LATVAIDDPTVYPVEERVGEDIVQRWIVELLRPLVERWLAEAGRPWFVGADQFIYYRQFDAHRRVAPDVYVLPGVSPDTLVQSWKVWETGIVPSFALEVVSRDWAKDYAEGPRAYGELGVEELVIFDPRYVERRDGLRFQRFQRTDRGMLECVERTNADRVSSSTLGCVIRATGFERDVRLRIAHLPDGERLFPTFAEAERAAREAERAAREAERAAREAERAAREAERTAREAERSERVLKEAALARIAELEAELRRRQKA
jgi:hypothetical protein